MQKAMSTYVHVKRRLHPGLLDEMLRAGAETIEIFGARSHFNYTDKEHIRETAAWFRNAGIPVNSLHSPMFSDSDWERFTTPINVVETDRKRRIEAMDEIKRALEVAETLPFRFLVQHLGNSGEEFDERKFEAAMTSVEHLRAFARPLGVSILVENIPNEMSTPEKLAEFIRTLRQEDVGVCFDFGHAHIMSSVPQAFDVLKAHIRSTHVHDNKRDRDAHLWPGDGNIDWREAMELAQSAPHVPPILLEIEEDPTMKIFQKMEETFRKLGSYATVER
jgi:sugar phosphate isomerase/epimerase